MNTKNIFLIMFLGIIFSGSSIVAQIQSAGNGEWSAGTTWVGGLAPTSNDDILINNQDTISVSDQSAVCKSLSFGGNEAQIDMNTNARLTVYGNFSIFSFDHTAFSAGWSGTDSKIVFAGNADQMLIGWNPEGGSTSFRDVVVDKTGGTISTDGTGMRLGIQNSLQIINGSFLLNDDDDIDGRWASNGNYTNNPLPNIIVEENGEFDMGNEGYHHIRSGVGSPIGKVTIYGVARFTRASSTGIFLNDVDIEDQGDLLLSSELWSSGSGVKFHPGTITTKSGGWINLSSTSPIWDNDSLVEVKTGAYFSTTASTTFFPNNFIEQGTVRYGRTADASQIITDRNYLNLLIEVNNLEKKTWELGMDRTVDNLTVSDEGQLVISSGTGNNLTVNTAINITSGSINLPSTSSALINLGAAATISEDGINCLTGKIFTERMVNQGVNNSFGNIGFEINSAGVGPGQTYVKRVTGESLTIDNNKNSIFRYFEIDPANNSGLNAELKMHYFDRELNGINEADLGVYFSDDEGATWTEFVSIVDTTSNTVTISGVNSILGTFTLAEKTPIGIPEFNLNIQKVTIYPNPASTEITVEINIKYKTEIYFKLYTLEGKMVMGKNINNLNSGANIININVSDLENGLYYYVVNDGLSTISNKLIVAF